MIDFKGEKSYKKLVMGIDVGWDVWYYVGVGLV